MEGPHNRFPPGMNTTLGCQAVGIDETEVGKNRESLRVRRSKCQPRDDKFTHQHVLSVGIQPQTDKHNHGKPATVVRHIINVKNRSANVKQRS